MKCLDNGLLGWRIFHDVFTVQAERNFKYGRMDGAFTYCTLCTGDPYYVLYTALLIS